jgi:hypothetical protein
MKLVHNWRHGWRWLSVHLMALGAAIQGAWLAVPDTMRAFLPDKWSHIAALVAFVAGMAARFIAQPVQDVPPESKPDPIDHP